MFLDLTGQRFGRLLVLKRIWWTEGDKNYGKWLCQCDCGTRTMVRRSDLRQGKQKSCGCLMREIAKYRHRKHGAYKTKEYTVWVNIIKLTRRKGIPLEPRWIKYSEFIKDVGRRPSSLDKFMLYRKDPAIGFVAGNCMWCLRRNLSRMRNTWKSAKLSTSCAS